jgi:hypothetical protein
VTYLYAAAVCLVGAQLLGIYALVSRKADLIFSIFMVGMVALSVALGAYGAYTKLA